MTSKNIDYSRRVFMTRAAALAYVAPLVLSAPAQASYSRTGSNHGATRKSIATAKKCPTPNFPTDNFAGFDPNKFTSPKNPVGMPKINTTGKSLANFNQPKLGLGNNNLYTQNSFFTYKKK